MRTLVVSLVLAVACSVRAEDTTQVYFAWRVPLGTMCPPRSVLLGDLAQLTEQRFVESEADADVVVSGAIDETADGVRAQIESHAADGTALGTRELTAASCAELRRPLGLVLALLLDEPVASRRRTRVEVGVEGALATSILPRASAGLGLGLRWFVLSWLPLRAAITYWFPVIAETARGEGARLTAAGGSLALCPRLVGGSRGGLFACLGADAGGLFADPRGLDSERPRRSGYALGVLQLSAALRLGRRAALWADAGPTISLVRPELYFERSDGSRVRVQRAPVAGAIFHVGLTIGAP